MKLELKDLAPYLPYGLQLKCQRVGYGKPWIETLTRLYFSPSKDELDVTTVNSILSKDEYRPILRPLSDLTKEIMHNEKKFIPLTELVNDIFGWAEMHNDTFCYLVPDEFAEEKIYFGIEIIKGQSKIPSFHFNEYHNGTEQENIDHSFEFTYDYVRTLISWHFDVFGLIERGFAINKNTIE